MAERGKTPSVSQPQLSETVAGLLRDRIMSGQLRPGERIRLEKVAQETGLSITPVREALLMLRAEDMVELQPRRGHVVAPLSRQDIIDVFGLQGHIAGELAARVALSITPDQLDDLRQQHERLRRAAQARQVSRVEQLEYEFHRRINRLADARKLSWLLRTVTRYTPSRFYAADPEWRAGMVADHEALLDALEARDPETVRPVMARHFTDGAERLVKHLDGLGVWNE
ncbi:DNA-binding GntR family transcriptional regulator [Micromonospora echinospora]|uniref:DNA-binding GntR family transcriptional regulator n=1 Tax=Micromonospora echinospora TaxID=1877 RepID=A0ABR6MC28_MICEC|nr:GntR family transcriptional regulator [Micromonospora echinospora]MBB5112938.1 DNA-binding GntR family transcriptional regulator [Micromonospora echinospora]